MIHVDYGWLTSRIYDYLNNVKRHNFSKYFSLGSLRIECKTKQVVLGSRRKEQGEWNEERWKAIEGYVLGTDRILYNVSQKYLSRGHNEESTHHFLSALIKSGSSHINFPTLSVHMVQGNAGFTIIALHNARARCERYEAQGWGIIPTQSY